MPMVTTIHQCVFTHWIVSCGPAPCQVCVLGLTTTAAPTSEMYPVWVKDPYSSGRDCIKALKQQHPDCALTVLLSHLG